MATASTVKLDLENEPVYYSPGSTAGLAKKASELLQRNHERHHIFFNNDGFHNHIAHQALTLYSLNAKPNILQKAYDANTSYQRKPYSIDESTIKDLETPEKFVSYLGPQEHYNNFLEFYQRQFNEHGWQRVLQKCFFAEDEQAQEMIVRLHSGFLHPAIHLGFAIEHGQPALMAEALAQAACHDSWIGRYLLPAEEAASKDSSTKSIVELLDEIRADGALSSAAQWSDGNKLRDGIMARAGDRMIKIGAQVHVKPEELERKTAEMTNAVCYYTAGAQHPPNKVMFDFYYIHAANSSIFYPAFLRQTWLTPENKARLLEYKIRMDLALYASRRSPEIHLSEIRNYAPKSPSGWDQIHERVCNVIDDGHAPKLIRALASGQKVCQPYEDRPEFRIKGADWLQMGHMAIDSVEDAMARRSSEWVRSAGFEEAWDGVPLNAQL